MDSSLGGVVVFDNDDAMLHTQCGDGEFVCVHCAYASVCMSCRPLVRRDRDGSAKVDKTIIICDYLQSRLVFD